MKQTNEQMGERMDKDILFSKTVKAGKRVYYIDVKRDRRDALYLSITESKRVRDGNSDEHPVFEKHKIFLYREDVLKFMSALNAATQFTIENGPECQEYSSFRDGRPEGWDNVQDCYLSSERKECNVYGDFSSEESDDEFDSDRKIKFDVDF